MKSSLQQLDDLLNSLGDSCNHLSIAAIGGSLKKIREAIVVEQQVDATPQIMSKILEAALDAMDDNCMLQANERKGRTCVSWINYTHAQRLQAMGAALEVAGVLATEDSKRLDYIERKYEIATTTQRYLTSQMVWGKSRNGRSLRDTIDKERNK